MLAERVVYQLSPPLAKIALFGSLFRGREDVYPRRFENRRTGKSGYAPACGNEWALGICDKPRIKCSDCSHRSFLPVTDDVIRWHLTGHDDTGREFVMGVYPMLMDETCHFLAIDFDKSEWQADAVAVVETCRRLGLGVGLERSRSGNGGHVWFFFENALPAAIARRLGAHVLTETMDRRPDIGLDSYDRLFPNQDTLPTGGFGNLIALPLQKKAREQGNSVFLDDQFHPHVDQWAFLANMPRIATSLVDDIVARAERKGRIVGVRSAAPVDDENDAITPWSRSPSKRHDLLLAAPLPRSLEVVLGSQIYISKEGLPAPLRNRLIRLAAFQNPEFYRAQAMRLPTYDKPRIIACAEDRSRHLALPRGCLEDVRSLLGDHSIEISIRDERCVGSPLAASFQGELVAEQADAAQQMLAHDIGTLSAPTAFGKTVVAAWMIAQRGVNTLILVHRRQLMEQWADRLSSFLNLSIRSIGRLGGGRKSMTGQLDIAVIQSLFRKGEVDDRVAGYGHVIVDECHHLSAYSFEQVIRQAKARYILGLSATVARKDGSHPIIFMQCGPIRHRVDAKALAEKRPFRHVVHVRPTGFNSDVHRSDNPRSLFQSLYAELGRDPRRNQLIAGDTLNLVRQGRSPLVLTERNEHLDLLVDLLQASIQHLIVLRGGMRQKALRAVADRLAAIPESEERVILATGRYVGEGFDDARLDTLLLGLPVSWRGTVAQYVGRLHRLRHGKREVQVYDYADFNVPMLARMFERRRRGYESIGYSVSMPASAEIGWPATVPLPDDIEWKNRFLVSVRRLARDGVDEPLAQQFASIARSPTADAQGIERARSATEAFLFERLQSLSATAGRFQLNTTLPIPFDGRGEMEVDFVCEEARIAIEIDGSAHFQDLNCYRRDRRKDQLLQENGYLVLRFLAEDVGSHLHDLLDAILHSMGRRTRQSR